MEIYDFENAIERYRNIIIRLKKSERALSLLERMASLGLLKATCEVHRPPNNSAEGHRLQP